MGCLYVLYSDTYRAASTSLRRGEARTVETLRAWVPRFDAPRARVAQMALADAVNELPMRSSVQVCGPPADRDCDGCSRAVRQRAG